MMVAVMMVPASAERLCQILNVGELATLRRVRKIRRELVELIRRGRVAIVAGGLRRALQIGGNLPGELLIFGRIRLLKLLERAQHLGQR